MINPLIGAQTPNKRLYPLEPSIQYDFIHMESVTIATVARKHTFLESLKKDAELQTKRVSATDQQVSDTCRCFSRTCLEMSSNVLM